MLYQASVPIAKQVGSRHRYLNKLSLHTELSQHPQSASKTTEAFLSFPVWAKKVLHCWRSVLSAFSLYLTPTVQKKKKKKKAQNTNI